MNVYVELKKDLPINSDIQKAIDGFENLCYDIKFVTLEDLILGVKNFENLARNNVFVGSIDFMTRLFKNVGIEINHINFPDSVIDLIGRKIEKTGLKSFVDSFDGTPKFVKPVQTKLFDGVLVSDKSHLSFFKDFGNIDVYVSDKIDIVSEWRCYIHKNKLVYSCNYSGDFKIMPDWNYVNSLIERYENALISYTIDVAVETNQKTTVIEFNDFWAIGSYGLDCSKYSEMLKDRYFEIIGKNYNLNETRI